MERKVLCIFFAVILSIFFSVNVFAQDTNSKLRYLSKEVYTNEDVVYSYSSNLQFSTDNEFSINAVWVTYDKTVVLCDVSQLMEPPLSYWPSSIYYKEPNPSGYGPEAVGTLYIVSQSKVPGSISMWDVTYSGTMGYYLY